jgi:hypothetical protein
MVRNVTSSDKILVSTDTTYNTFRNTYFYSEFSANLAKIAKLTFDRLARRDIMKVINHKVKKNNS